MSLHSPDMLSSISCEKAAGSCLNLALQFRSRHSKASRTVSGFSSLVSAARVRICLAWAISVSGFVVAVAVAVEERAEMCGCLVGSLVCGVVKAAAYCANASRIKNRFMGRRKGRRRKEERGEGEEVERRE